jgi:restriction system protein
MKNFISGTDAAAGAVKSRLRAWLVGLFIAAVKSISKEEDRIEVLVWFSRSQNVISSNIALKDKLVELYALMDGKKTVGIVVNSVTASVKNYVSADLPLAAKIAVPFTLLAMPIVGGHGAGIAAFGSAIGLPVLLLIFLGTAGIAAVLEPFVTSKSIRNQILLILTSIACAEAIRRINAAVETGTQGVPRDPAFDGRCRNTNARYMRRCSQWTRMPSRTM